MILAPARDARRTGAAGDARVAEALSGEAGVEGVRWLLGGRPIRRLIRDELRGLLADSSRLGPCVLRRAKFKPNRKLSAYYDVGLAGGRARSIAVTWQPVGTAARRRDGDEQEMEEEALAAGLAAPFKGLRTEAPGLGMHIAVAPLDATFRQLVRLCTPGHVRAMTSEAVPGLQWNGGPGMDLVVTAIRYRPGQRHVLRYDGGSPRQTVFAKLYRDGEGDPAFRVATQISNCFASTEASVSAVRPLAYVPEDEVVLYPRVVGTPLSRYPVERVGNHLVTAGVALTVLQRAPVEQFDEVRPHSFEGEVRAVARAGEHIAPLHAVAGATLGRILERVRALHQRLEAEPPVLAHGDYKTDHAWANRGGITLIDFNTCSLADPALDIGKFLADLRWWYSSSGAEPVRRAQQAFLEGYGSGATPDRMLRARLYEVLILTKITLRRVRLFDAEWSSKTDGFLNLADAMLDELERSTDAPTARARRLSGAHS